MQVRLNLRFLIQLSETLTVKLTKSNTNLRFLVQVRFLIQLSETLTVKLTKSNTNLRFLVQVGLNPKFFIQLSEILTVKLTKTYSNNVLDVIIKHYKWIIFAKC